MKKAYIYKITSPSGKRYVGSTINIIKRKQSYGNITAKQQVKIYRSIKKYGWQAHKFEIIFVTTQEYMLTAERRLADYYNCLCSSNGLNLRLPKIGDVRCVSDETRAKISLASAGRRHSDETKAKLKLARNRRTVKPHTDETKKKISLKNKGRKPTTAAIQNSINTRRINGVSEETRKKLSLLHKGRVASEETRIKMSKYQKGKFVSEETRRKQSVLRKGRPMLENNYCLVRSRMVLNTEIGVYYESLTQAANSIHHISSRYLQRMLSGVCRNKSNFIYV